MYNSHTQVIQFGVGTYIHWTKILKIVQQFSSQHKMSLAMQIVQNYEAYKQYDDITFRSKRKTCFLSSVAI